jgi:hypothetical protein
VNASLREQIAAAQAELASIKREMTNYVMVPHEEYEKQRALYLSEAADVVDAMLTKEPDNTRASALYEALLKLRGMQPCTCAGSWGLHENSCRKYVPGHELLSPVNALAAYRAEPSNR